jgi:CelD/BcsL family acetyltransferase involved in cellulose biosynthesis
MTVVPETAELRLEPIADLAGAQDDWRRLAHAAPNPFTSWEWASTWWRHLGGRSQLRAQRCVDAAGRTAGILPLQLSSSHGLRVLRFVGHRAADELAPLSAPEDRPAVARAFVRSLGQGKDWDVCLAERLPAAEGWPAELGGRVVREEPSPELELHTSSWDEYLAGRSRNFRQQVRKFERRLLRDHGLEYRLADDPDRLDEDMSELIRLHEARWGAVTTAFPPDLLAFQRDFAAAALEAGWLRLWFAEVEGRPAAALYILRLGGADWVYQQGRDPAWDRASLGFVLIVHTLRDAVEAGTSRYRFLLGGEEYKRRFTTAEPEVQTVALARGARGGAAIAAVAGLRRLPPALRRRLGRLAERT